MDEPRLAVPLFDFAIALFIGALVGIEREKKIGGAGRARDRRPAHLHPVRRGGRGQRRGSPCASETPWIFVGTGFLVIGAGGGGLRRPRAPAPGLVGLTTEIAAIVVYLLGGTTLFGFPELAVALAIATSAVLAFKEPLHEPVERIGRDDLYAGLKLLIATFIVLPVLPDRAARPVGRAEPLQDVVAGDPDLGPLAGGLRRDARARLAGAASPSRPCFGGLVSSTAVTLSLRAAQPRGGRARRARAARSPRASCSRGR